VRRTCPTSRAVSVWPDVPVRHTIGFAESAIADLEVPEVGERLLREVVLQVEQLADFPESGRVVPEFGSHRGRHGNAVWAWSVFATLQLFRPPAGQRLEVLAGDDRLTGLGFNVLACPAGHCPAVLGVLLQRHHTL